MKPDKEVVLVSSVDSNGAKAAIWFSPKDGHWQVGGAVEHTWGGDTTVGGKVIASW